MIKIQFEYIIDLYFVQNATESKKIIDVFQIPFGTKKRTKFLISKSYSLSNLPYNSQISYFVLL